MGIDPDSNDVTAVHFTWTPVAGSTSDWLDPAVLITYHPHIQAQSLSACRHNPRIVFDASKDHNRRISPGIFPPDRVQRLDSSLLSVSTGSCHDADLPCYLAFIILEYITLKPERGRSEAWFLQDL